MKLFIWADPYQVPYGTSAYFAVAETVEEARKLAIKAPRYSYVRFYDGDGVGQSDQLLAVDPTRIVDLPCGEWHEWAE